MTTLLETITAAARESNLIAAGASLTTAQKDEALVRLLSLISSVYGSDVGENMVDWPIGISGLNSQDWNAWTVDAWKYPVINSRLLLNHTEAQTVHFPECPSDGARISVITVNGDPTTNNITLDGNGRLIAGAATLVVSTTPTVTYMYRADLADWVVLSALTEDSDLPFPPEFDDYFIIRLAMRLNPRYGRAIAQESALELNMQKQQIQARYRQKQSVPTQPGVLRTSTPNRRTSSAGSRSWMS